MNTFLLPGLETGMSPLSEYIHAASDQPLPAGVTPGCCVCLPGDPSQVCLSVLVQDQLSAKTKQNKQKNTFKNRAIELLKQNEMGQGGVAGGGGGGEPHS